MGATSCSTRRTARFHSWDPLRAIIPTPPRHTARTAAQPYIPCITHVHVYMSGKGLGEGTHRGSDSPAKRERPHQPTTLVAPCIHVTLVRGLYSAVPRDGAEWMRYTAFCRLPKNKCCLSAMRCLPGVTTRALARFLVGRVDQIACMPGICFSFAYMRTYYFDIIPNIRFPFCCANDTLQDGLRQETRTPPPRPAYGSGSCSPCPPCAYRPTCFLGNARP